MKRFFPRWWRILMTRDGRSWLVPRWCRILMMEVALVGGIFGHFYAVHHRTPEPEPVPSYIWLDLAADAAAFGRDIAAAHALQILAGMEPK